MTEGMLVVQCSIITLSGIANSYTSNLIIRAADVCLKEGRKVILAVRETQLHAGHLRLMQQVAEVVVVIFPPVLSFYPKPETLDQLITDLAGRFLLPKGIVIDAYGQWK
jgi:flavin prenyltransferase